MLHTHLENFKSDFPITAVSLEAQAAKPSQQQFGLFETALRNPAQLSETLARLTGLLGARSCRHAGSGRHASSGRFPSRAISPGNLMKRCRSKKRIAFFRALRRFRSPVSASVLSAENQPAHLQSAEVHGAVRTVAGPYHSSGNWWDENSLGARGMGFGIGEWRALPMS